MLRDFAEVQRAHDVLEALVQREIKIGQSDETIRRAKLMLTVLCWVLGHESGDDFASTVGSVENCAVAMGYRILDTQATEGRADAAAH